MALNNDATFVATGGHFYYAPVGTSFPTNVLQPGTEWKEVGHTSISDIGTLEGEGGDKTVIGSLQNKALRTVTAPKTYSWPIVVHQFDPDALKLYFGSDAQVNATTNLLEPTDSPVPTSAAFMAVINDGTNALVVYGARAEISAGDNIELSSEDLSTLPLSVNFLTNEGAKGPFQIGLVDTATGATTPTEPTP